MKLKVLLLIVKGLRHMATITLRLDKLLLVFQTVFMSAACEKYEVILAAADNC